MEREPEKFQAIIDELNRMVEVDQTMRNCSLAHPDEWDDTVDYQNTKRMKAIVKYIGWPSISKVGYAGSSNAWLVVQHSDHDPSFQKKCLTLMKSKPEDDVSRSDIAYLEDRIAVAEGRLQIYGTQFYRNSDGQMIPHPISDPKNIEKRRKEMELDTFEEYQQSMTGRNRA